MAYKPCRDDGPVSRTSVTGGAKSKFDAITNYKIGINGQLYRNAETMTPTTTNSELPSTSINPTSNLELDRKVICGTEIFNTIRQVHASVQLKHAGNSKAQVSLLSLQGREQLGWIATPAARVL